MKKKEKKKERKEQKKEKEIGTENKCRLKSQK